MSDPRSNLVRNGSFAQMDGGPPAGWDAVVAADLNKDGEKSGIEILQFAEYGNAVKLRSAPVVTTWYAIESESIALEAPATLELSATMKTENVHRDVSESPLGPMADKLGLHLPDDHPSRSNVELIFFDDDGDIVPVDGSDRTGTDPVMGTHDWHRVSATIPTPEGAVTARVRCVMTLYGGALFSDVRLTR
jgi:hypothetical protein